MIDLNELVKLTQLPKKALDLHKQIRDDIAKIERDTNYQPYSYVCMTSEKENAMSYINKIIGVMDAFENRYAILRVGEKNDLVVKIDDKYYDLYSKHVGEIIKEIYLEFCGKSLSKTGLFDFRKEFFLRTSVPHVNSLRTSIRYL